MVLVKAADARVELTLIRFGDAHAPRLYPLGRQAPDFHRGQTVTIIRAEDVEFYACHVRVLGGKPRRLRDSVNPG